MEHDNLSNAFTINDCPLVIVKKSALPKNELRFISVIERSTNKLWGAHFRVPAQVVKKLSSDDHRRVVCSLNGVAEYQCAMLPFGNGAFVISVNKQLRDKLKLEFGMNVDVTLRKDKSEYGLPLPEELQILFEQDKVGSKLFHSLTRGRQRTLLYIIGHVKDQDKRVAHSITIINHLKANKGKINYRQLSAALKDPRRRVATYGNSGMLD